MGKILVTGSTGRLGSAVLRSLAQKAPASSLVALARNARKTRSLTSMGIEVRYGDYADYKSLVVAFSGVDKIYLVSADVFSDRLSLHKNVIDAARRAGVRHVIYTSIQRLDQDQSPIQGLTDSDIATEALLKRSGLDYTIVWHPLYADELPTFIGDDATKKDFSAPAGQGRIALTSSDELAEAGAVLLSQDGHENREYLLNSGQAWSFEEIAQTLSRLTGKAISYQSISAETFIAAREAEGWPPMISDFVTGWFSAIEKGAFNDTSSTLEELLGRKPKGLEAILKGAFDL
ncbi:SDR family oxidoreductase [Pseudomonas sp. O230]|uniref:SDR family oxidoreductase n=1 Tax=Pseudomonas sp. O230 TaxID=3159450 RepID=UPI00387B6F36